jgi:hypothetical protein
MRAVIHILYILMTVYALQANAESTVHENKRSQVTIIHELTAKHYKLIEVAIGELSRNNLSLEPYRIILMQIDSIYYVLFRVDDDHRIGWPNKNPSFEVKFAEDASRIDKSYFSQ